MDIGSFLWYLLLLVLGLATGAVIAYVRRSDD